MFLGLGKSTRFQGMEAETGWLTSRYRRYCEIGRLCHKLVNMDNYRLTYKVFKWDLHLTVIAIHGVAMFKPYSENVAN